MHGFGSKSSNYENYNNPFSLDELTDAISKSHDTAVGPDDIHYQMLKHLPNDALLTHGLQTHFLITSGLRENFLQAGVLLQLYQFLTLVKIHLTLLTIAQLLSLVAFARSWSA